MSYSGTEGLLDNTGNVGFDSFYVTLTDIEGRESIKALYSINIYSALVAIPYIDSNTNPIAEEGLLSNITLYGNDQSIHTRDMYVKIISLPLHGKLYQLLHHRIQLVTINDILDTKLIKLPNEINNQIIILYQSNNGYFTSPTKSYQGLLLNQNPDSFQYQIISKSSTVSESLISTQYIHIRNVNNPTDISFKYSDIYKETQEIVIYAVGLTTNNDKYRSKAIINGFDLIDKDNGVDVMRVTISTTHGIYYILYYIYFRNININNLLSITNLSNKYLISILIT